jgi:uncharacterized protein DUF6350
MVATPNDPVDLALPVAPGGANLPGLARPRLPVAPPLPVRKGAPLPVAAVVAAGWATLISFLPLLLLTAIAAGGQGAPLRSVFRLSAAAWLLGHGVPVQTPADRITLIPLGITAFVVWRLVRAGVHASRATQAHRHRSIRPAVAAGASVAVAYTGIGLLLSWLTTDEDRTTGLIRTLVAFGLIGGAAATLGALAHGRAARRLLARMPSVLTDGLRGGLGVVAFLLAAGAGTAGIALALAGGDAATMLASFGAGVAGQAGITAICLVYLPNLAVWGAAYLLGPGFAVGDGTVVSPGDVLLGPVPGLPVLAGLPNAPLTGVGPVLLGLPLLAGLAAGFLLARRRPGGWAGLLGAAALAGPIGGLGLQLLSTAARGGIGSGRMAVLGAYDWRVGLFAAGVTTVGALAGAVAARTVTRPRSG